MDREPVAARTGSSRIRRWTVGTLCRAIADAMDSRFNPVEVIGEISGFTRVASGHCYFALKDEAGQIRCAMFRRAAALIDFQPRDGDRVVARGRLGVYDPRGELQLVVESMSRAGAGTLFEQFLRLKAKLESEGLFEAARKRPVPKTPRGIGIVTSAGGAAIHDVLTSLKRRAPHVPVVLSPAQVQGTGAPAGLVAAMDRLGEVVKRRTDGLLLDVILLVRGGGSIEDMMAFNDEEVARAIARSPVPLISGIGHETDFTIADFVADLRAPTPTAAAELATRSQADLLDELQLMAIQISRRANEQLERRDQALDYLTYKASRPAAIVSRQSAQLTACARQLILGIAASLTDRTHWLEGRRNRLPDLARNALDRERHRLDQLGLRLRLMDPSEVLGRGYVWVTGPAGNALPRMQLVSPGDILHLRFVDGEVIASAMDAIPIEKGRVSGP